MQQKIVLKIQFFNDVIDMKCNIIRKDFVNSLTKILEYGFKKFFYYFFKIFNF